LNSPKAVPPVYIRVTIAQNLNTNKRKAKKEIKANAAKTVP
jgi:hypothetical protein